MPVLIRIDDEEMDKMVKYLKNFEVVQSHTDYREIPPRTDAIEYQRLPFRFVRKGGNFDVEGSGSEQRKLSGGEQGDAG